MDLRFVTASVLLLGTSAFAQIPTPPAQKPPAPAAQDPDKPQPSPEQTIRELTTEKERLAREIEYVQARAKQAKASLAEKLSGKQQAFRSIDAGVNVNPIVAKAPAMQPPKLARVATAEELANHPNDTMLVVNGRAVPQGAFDQLMAFLAASPASGDEKVRAQRALFDLIRIEAIASAFEDNEAADRIGEIDGQLAAGKSLSELAKAVGVVPGSGPDGQLEVTRNSVFGPRFEQIAFSVPAGQRSRPFRNPHGLVILQVDSVEKGASPELDRVKATAVQVPYSSDAAAVQKAHLAANTGQVDILARDQKTLELLPEMFRQPVGQDAGLLQVDTGTVDELTRQLKQLDADIAELQKQPDEESKKKVELLKAQREKLQERLRASRDSDAPIEIKEAKEPVKK